MTAREVSYQELDQARKTLIAKLKKELSEAERQFLLSVKERTPNWRLLGLKGIENLPAVQWKLENLGRMKPPIHRKAVERLKAILDL